jgi:casein kinase 1
MSSSNSSSSTNVVGVHYKVGRKLGEGSFGIIYEGKNINHLNTLTIHIHLIIHMIRHQFIK